VSPKEKLKEKHTHSQNILPHFVCGLYFCSWRYLKKMFFSVIKKVRKRLICKKIFPNLDGEKNVPPPPKSGLFPKKHIKKPVLKKQQQTLANSEQG